MPAQVLEISAVKKVTKPWGWERWIADDSFPYCLKEIFIKAPHQSSLQIHQEKYETGYIQEGTGFLHVHAMDVMNWKALREEDINYLVGSTYTVPLLPGTVFHVKPGNIHRVEAVTDILLIEASTTQLDDVMRLSDQSNRPHGRIESEHG